MPGSEMFDNREIEAVVDVLKRGILHRYAFQNERDGIYRVAEFESAVAKKMGSGYCQATSSGSTALVTLLKALGVGPGDEVITTPFTFVASVEAVMECGAVPILGEIDESLNLDPESVYDCITDATRVVMPVHMFGGASDNDSFKTIAKDYGLYFVEDACQAMGATYKGKRVGTMGHAGAYSLDPYKILTTGEGGLIVTDDEEIYHRSEYVADHGHIHNNSIDRGAEKKACLGMNYRMSEIQGALGLVQLDKLDGAISTLRSNKKKILDMVGCIDGLQRRKLPDPDGETATQIVFLLPTSEAARKFQAAAKKAGYPSGVLADNLWHYVANWENIREGLTYSHLRCPYDCPINDGMPSYRRADYPKTADILDRTAVFGLNIMMSDEKLEKMAQAIQEGARAAL